MKKIVIAVSVLLVITAILSTVLVIQNQEDMIAKVPEIKLLINDIAYDNRSLESPVIEYKQIVYVPINDEWGELIGFQTDQSDGLRITSKNPLKSSKLVCGDTEQPDEVPVKWYTNTILKDSEEIKTFENRPFLEYQDTIYLPLTWKVMNQGFGCDYYWLANKQLVIHPLNSLVMEDTTESTDTIEEQSIPAANPVQPTKNVSFKMQYLFDVPGDTDQITFTCVVPKDFERRQIVQKINYSIDPIQTFEKNETKYATFIINNPAKDVCLDIESEIVMMKYDFEMAKTFDAPEATNEDAYLNAEQYIESNDPKMINALELEGKSTDEKLNKIHTFVLNRMSYKDIDSDEGALFAYQNRKGDCQEYSDLFIALCRAEGIPARISEGFATVGTANGHEWVEAYHEDYGWIPFDLTFSDSEYAEDEYTFEHLENVYIYMTHLRNDPQFEYVQNGNKKYGHYWECSFEGDRIAVERKVEFK